jgi:hypothetical protein
MMTAPQRIQNSVFLVITMSGDRKLFSRGVAFGVGGNRLVTCAHVVHGMTELLIAAYEPVLGGRRHSIGTVIRTDERLDLALLKIECGSAPSLDLGASDDALDDATPLLVVVPPKDAVEVALQRNDANESIASWCTTRAAVRTGSWSMAKAGRPCFSYAGCAEDGMSGGPVVCALSGQVVGVVFAQPPIDPGWAAEAWEDAARTTGTIDFSEVPSPTDLVAAQLAIGTGLALPASELRAFLGSTP